MSFRLIWDEHKRVGEWVAEGTKGQWRPGDATIGAEVDGKLVFGALYEGFTGASINIHSRCVGNPPRAFFAMAFDYPFNQLKVKRLTGIVNENNSEAIRFNEHCGFEREAYLRDYFPDGGAIVYAMHREQCRFLSERWQKMLKDYHG